MSEESHELVVTNDGPGRAVVQRSFFTMEPEQQINYASRIATVLADVISKQKLYSEIQGRKYVKVEGWQTLGTFLGVTAKERSVSRLVDGSYEAFVDLVKFADGSVVGGASALCSINEKRWGNADDYARRSMAITRATGKAYRCAFAWIVTLAGYEATPEEEMPREEKRIIKEEKKVEPKKDLKADLLARTYDENDMIMANNLTTTLETSPKYKDRVKPEHHVLISRKLHGKLPKDLPSIVNEVVGAQ